MQEKSDSTRPWKDTAMTVCACGSLSALDMCCLLIDVGHRCVITLTRILIICLTAGSYTVWDIVHTRSGPMCTNCAFLTSSSCIPISLHGQSDQYSTHFIASFLPNIPILSVLTGDTNQRPGSSCSSLPAKLSLSLQLQLAHTKLSTCLVKISSLEAL